MFGDVDCEPRGASRGFARNLRRRVFQGGRGSPRAAALRESVVVLEPRMNTDQHGWLGMSVNHEAIAVGSRASDG